MHKFLFDKSLHTAIRKILSEPKARCGVAFWGEGAEKMVRSDAKIICNLKSGGTNPFVIEKLPRKNLRQCDRLHAKVYIGTDRAVVTSANASANGLGLEGAEQTSWFEAGTLVSNPIAARKWFDELWKKSPKITDEDIKAAKAAWALRQRYKPTLASFSDFDEAAAALPLLTWIDKEDYTICEEKFADQPEGIKALLRTRIASGLRVEHADDRHLLPGRWVLAWTPKADGSPRRRSLFWLQLSDLVMEDAILHEGEKYDAVLEAEPLSPVPFDASEPRFESAFRAVLSQSEFKNLVDTEYEDAWFRPRNHLIQAFWKQVKAEYHSRDASSQDT